MIRTCLNVQLTVGQLENPCFTALLLKAFECGNLFWTVMTFWDIFAGKFFISTVSTGVKLDGRGVTPCISRVRV
jgi:hypothetical protein